MLPEFEKFYALTEISPGRFGIDNYGREDYLLVNNGQGRFEDATRASGIYGHGDGLSATWFDYDSDGWPDLYVANDFTDPDQFFLNNGDGTFTDITEASGIAQHLGWGMGTVCCDFDADGDTDIFVANDVAENFLLFLLFQVL